MKKPTLRQAVKCIRAYPEVHDQCSQVLLAFADKMADALPQRQSDLIRHAKRAGLGRNSP